MSDNRTQSWVAEGSSLQVDCPDTVLHTITTAVRHGFRQFRHGGMEVGGILVGSTHGSGVRVVDALPMTIEYGRGPFFLLSDAEHDSLDRLIEETTSQVARSGLEVVGFYESHTRRDISLAEADLETYDGHFPAPLKICIVQKPEKENVTRTAVYIRDEDGSILETTSAGYSLIVEEAAPIEPAPMIETEPVIPQRHAAVPVIPAPVSVAEPVPVTLPVGRVEFPVEQWRTPGPAPQGILVSRRKWIYAGVAALAAAIAAAIWAPRTPSPPPVLPTVAAPIPPSTPINPTPAPPPPEEVAATKPTTKAKSSRKAKGRSRNQRTRRAR